MNKLSKILFTIGILFILVLVPNIIFGADVKGKVTINVGETIHITTEKGNTANKIYGMDLPSNKQSVKKWSIVDIDDVYVNVEMTNDTTMVEGKKELVNKQVDVKGIRGGTVYIQAEIYYYSGGYGSQAKTEKYWFEVTVNDPEGAKKAADDAQKTSDIITSRIENDWKNIPSKSASSGDITYFIISDILNNKGQNIASQSTTTHEAWKRTLDSFTNNGNVSAAYIQMIQYAKNILNTLTTNTVYRDDATSGALHGMDDPIDNRRNYFQNNTNLINQAQDLTGVMQREREDIVNDLKRKFELSLEIAGEDRENVTFNDVFNDINEYKPNDISRTEASKIESIISTILSVITSIAMVVAIVMIAVLGFKYMIGSVEEKAEYKKDLIPYFVGAILVFGITAFIKILMQVGNQIGNL